MSRRIIARIAAGAGSLTLLGAAWLVLAPAQLGGLTAYALVVGNSMEPALQRGDLAVIRTRREYRPGDVVLYDSAELGAKVLHRIVRVENGRLRPQGRQQRLPRPGAAA